MEMKYKVLSLLGISIGSFSLLAFADTLNVASDLLFINNTDKFVTSKLNDGICSSKIPGGSPTSPHTQKKVPAWQVELGCTGHAEACKADVYITKDCTGQNIGTVVLNTKTNQVISINMHSTSYNISKSGFSFTLDPNPPK